MLSLTRLLAALIGVSSVAAAHAHHSYAQFDRTKDFSISGKITHIAWANPHVILVITTPESESYTIEWQGMNLLARSGLTKDSLRVGEDVTLVGARNRSPEIQTMTLIKEVTVPARNWHWEKTPVRNSQANPQTQR